MKKKLKMKDVKRGMALFDVHYPEHDKRCLDIAVQFCRDFNPDVFILGGDQMDMDCISFYNRNRPKLLEGKRLKKEYAGFQKDVLNRFEPLLGFQTDKYFFIGNHEYRVDRYLESNPQHEGFIEVEANLALGGWDVVPFNEAVSIGHMNFIHGIYWNKYHSYKHVNIYEDNLFYGHVHNAQVYTKTTPLVNLPKQGVGVGCMCNKNPSYQRNKPNSWINQFLFWYMFPDGNFTYYTPTIIEGRVVINNVLYDGGV